MSDRAAPRHHRAIDHTSTFRNRPARPRPDRHHPDAQLDAKRLTMSADDKLIVAAFNENGLNDASNQNKVVGGSAYDELVRIP